MKERAPAIVAILLLLALVAGTWWAADYARRSIPIDPPRRITHEPDSWATDFTMVRTDEKGIAINRLEGERMQHYPDDDSYEITRARAVGQQPGSPITVGTSNTAVMDQNGDRIIMKGDAHVRRQPGQDVPVLDVKSDELTLLPDQDVVFTDLPALVVHGKSVMNGTGMRYDNKTRQLQVFSATDVKISGEESRSKRGTSSGRTEKKP
ncbi:LPS export ABC transporter periplasmic protein LptC [Parapusillimonas granuli]|uniref:LPS export ABC transporter periplasmic protein LptC n=1 Tax=Parapusillimonas granuli TaxID=380911 RepID=A0A853FXK5_9BURK|nr:LPS export ABC transporter periplasmic protein LptC [Parapusillimonas granuli]MBB5214745.1 lipopolysaccharide export system protein LptC [Parapusillimonas granuli]MEB2398007.1 LPS export ABC transporter periplasmic protein LptC [Alcaligenaceae bacterium]NYT48847.1 LPS export ABC transporter periplasmic protein LptC [Parapusillimonas granuli]